METSRDLSPASSDPTMWRKVAVGSVTIMGVWLLHRTSNRAKYALPSCIGARRRGGQKQARRKTVSKCPKGEREGGMEGGREGGRNALPVRHETSLEGP